MINTINADVAIGPAHYKGFRERGEVLITSIFRTLQGEAPFTGIPAVFVRTAGCNYGLKSDFCRFCDTAFQFAAGKRMTFAELNTAVNAIKKPGDMLVITGGEPTLQYALIDWVKSMPQDAWRYVQFESNGTQYKFFEEVSNTAFAVPLHFVVSPKASYKTKKYPKLQDIVISTASALKFVLEPDKDSPQHDLPDWALNQDTTPVYVSPAAYYLRPPATELASAWDHTLIDAEKTERSYRYAAWYVMNHSHVQLSIQTHLFAALP